MTAGSPTRSALLWPGGVRERVADWFAQRVAETSCRIRRVPLTELRGWSFDPDTGNLRHDSGRFFGVEGLHVRTSYGMVPEWHQPVINQPEIGILGILVRVVDGQPYCLVQAKAEPGNSNTLQLSPTVQATRSNYSQIHRGDRTQYLEYFTERGAGRVLVDVLQSEQGSWFLHKRNRNMVVQVDRDVPVGERHHWVALSELRQLLRVDRLVNMDTRTVLACLPASFFPGCGEASTDAEWVGALYGSAVGSGARHADQAVLSWFTRAKDRHELRATNVPLRGLPGWHQRVDEITRPDREHFSIIGVDVRVDGREVAEWQQPLLRPHGQGVAAFLMKRIDGVAHVLAHALFQPGLLDGMEIGPTVQCTPQWYPRVRPRFLDEVLSAPAERVHYDTILAEEGGRFYRSDNRYMVVEAGDDVPLEEPEGFCWVTIGQLTALLRHSYYVNVEARSLLACMHTLW